MVNFREMSTDWVDLLMLQRALDAMGICWDDTKKELKGDGNESYKVDMVIKQPTSTNIGFVLQSGSTISH